MATIRLGYACGSIFTCQDGSEVSLNQDVLLYLNPDKFTSAITNPILAKIIAITTRDDTDPEEVNFSKVYVAEFDDADLPIGISSIKVCDLDPNTPPECRICASNCELQESVEINTSNIASNTSNIEQLQIDVSVLTQGTQGFQYSFEISGDQLIITESPTNIVTTLDISSIPSIANTENLNAQAGDYTPNASSIITIPIVDTDGNTISVVTIDLSSISSGGTSNNITSFSYNNTTGQYEISSGGSVFSADASDVDISVPGEVTITDANGDSATISLSASGGNLTRVGNILIHESSDMSTQQVDLTPIINTGTTTYSNVLTCVNTSRQWANSSGTLRDIATSGISAGDTVLAFNNVGQDFSRIKDSNGDEIPTEHNNSVAVGANGSLEGFFTFTVPADGLVSMDDETGYFTILGKIEDITAGSSGGASGGTDTNTTYTITNGNLVGSDNTSVPITSTQSDGTFLLDSFVKPSTNPTQAINSAYLSSIGIPSNATRILLGGYHVNDGNTGVSPSDYVNVGSGVGTLYLPEGLSNTAANSVANEAWVNLDSSGNLDRPSGSIVISGNSGGDTEIHLIIKGYYIP